MSTCVSKLASVIIPVADQDRAVRFYTETLGLESAPTCRSAVAAGSR
jgi:extradiol dioxygenase family protein